MSHVAAGICMFLGSIAAVVHRQRRLKSCNTRYKNILSQLFVPLANIKYNANHSQDAIFAERKKYFNSIMSPSLSRVRFIHVAGSKGKGSTTEYIAAGLRSQGFRVGVFTSPHIHTARERIKIGKDLISKEDVVRLGVEVLEEMKGFEWLVFFDLFLSIAIKYFSERSLDYVILETGIGGRYDSTNFLESPAACVITSISLDHQTLLGNTTEKIAW